jgi:DNA-directed RNA polymerase subunit beta
MPTAIQQNFSLRKSFAKIKNLVPVPNLIDIQRKSYDRFLQADIEPSKRENIGLQGVFKAVFPVNDYHELASLEFVEYVLQKPKHDVDECRSRDMTYAAPMSLKIMLVLWEKTKSRGRAPSARRSKTKSISARSR